MLPGVDHTAINSSTNIQNRYQINAPVQTPVQTSAQTLMPQAQGPQVRGVQGDVFELNRQQFLPQQKVELGVLDETLKRFGLFQDKLVQTAIKNNPQIAALCARSGINGRVEARNLNDASSHAKATAKFATKIGEYLDLDIEDLKTLGAAAKFHDIGKALIPREVFAKPGRFDEDEKEIMALHSDFSSEILKGLGFDKEVVDIAGAHHESYNIFDTSKVAKMSQILKVADIYSALTESRSYKKALNDDETFAIMDKMAQSCEISPDALAALKQSILDEKPVFEASSAATNPFAA